MLCIKKYINIASNKQLNKESVKVIKHEKKKACLLERMFS